MTYCAGLKLKDQVLLVADTAITYNSPINRNTNISSLGVELPQNVSEDRIKIHRIGEIAVATAWE